jgi:nicotinamidase/pyrazinamidase
VSGVGAGDAPVTEALVLVDLQNDFLPGGALAVEDGDAVVPVANRVQPAFELVVATLDWHPPRHGSFAASHPGRRPGDVIDLHGIEQILWPVHCVQGSPGAEFAPELDRSRIERVFHKGTDPTVDSYSAFFDNAHRRSTGLGDYLRERGVGTVALLGLATDYCVRYSALDARQLGFRTRVVVDGCRGVGLEAGDVERALDEMREAGVEMVTSEALLAVREGG